MNLFKRKVCLVMLFMLILTLIFTSTSAIAEQNTLDKILDEGVLKVGIMLDFPPKGYYDENGKPAGMNVEVAKKIAEMLDVRLEIVDTPAASRIPSLLTGQVDLSVSGLAITPQRALAVAFTRPYGGNTQWIITRKDSNINNFKDIAGKKIATVRGTTPESNIMKAVENWENKPEFISYTSNADALMALRQGKVDALAEAKTWFDSEILAKFPDQYKLAGPSFYKELSAIAIRKGDQEFLNYLNILLWTMTVLNDDLNDITMKYLGSPPPDEIYLGLD